MAMIYKDNTIDFDITLTNDSDTFENGERNKLIVGAKCRAVIKTFGGINGSTAEITIWGLSIKDIEVLTAHRVFTGTKSFNLIEVIADGNTCYQGYIASCTADLNSIDIPLTMQCTAIAKLSTIAGKPYTHKGNIKASEAIKEIVSPHGITVINDGLDAVISSPYLADSIFSRVNSIVSMVSGYAEYSYNKIYLAKDNKKSGKTIEISADNGLIGYPSYSDIGLSIATVFSNEYTLRTTAKVKTMLPLGSGDFAVIGISHDISQKLERGTFATNLLLTRIYK